jgi:MarR family transcriptional regulator, lower aerobic nicotinate degradation pathway regulator
MKKSSVIPLLEKWEVFSEENPKKDIYAFAGWLLSNHQDDSQTKDRFSDEDERGNSTRVAILITRLQKYLGLYIKPVINRLGFSREHEYNFLYQVSRMDKPTKNSLSKENMVEFSTGRDVIRRLIDSKLLMEKPDPEDKRARLLTLTSLGKKTLEKSYEQISETFTDFLGDLNPKEQSQLIRLLEKMNSYQAKKNNKEILAYL